MVENRQKITCKSHKRYWILGSVVLLLVVIGVILSLTLPNEDWLKAKIETYVHEKYQTDINIESLEFNPWKGYALLSDIALARNDQDRQVSAAIDFIELDIQLIPLIFRDIVVDVLVISQPDIKIDVQRKPEPITEDTLTCLEKVMVRVTFEVVIRPFIEALIAILEVFTGNTETAIVINELIIHEGHINYVAKRAGSAPFALVLRELEYSAKNINAKMPLDFATNADITAKIVLSETEAEFSQHFSQKPYSLSIADIDVGYLDTYLKQKDILQVNNGTANVKFLVDDETVITRIALQKLELSQNTNAVQKDFAFIPVVKLINYVNKADGDINLEFELEKSVVHTSQDLQFVVIEAWEGMWKQIFKKCLLKN
ncbi:MAG: hypothetical protein KAR20_06510 [Candidatus Heimdallarchaeota archaeon]|nr:hypothetical protein [Candidatus Heimdallarchaeota archaeon]